MRQRSKIERLWRMISPIVVKEVVLLLFYSILLVLVEERKVVPYITQITAIAGVLTIPILIWMIRQDAASRKDDVTKSKKTMRLRDYLFLVVISIAFTTITNFLLLLTNVAKHSETYQEISELLYAPSFGMQILCVGIAIPIVEELVFRGLIYNRLREYHSFAFSMIISAIVFGCFHGNLVQGIYGAMAGILLAYVFELFGTVKAPIIVHMAMNLTSCMLTRILQNC